VGYQQKPGWCGPAALQQALQIHGVCLSQTALAKALGTCDDGTSELGILQALPGLGMRAHVLETSRKADARTWLLRHAAKMPVVLCVDSWEHWVCVAGQCADRIWLLDSTREHWNKAKLGRYALKPKAILKRWKAAYRCRGDGGLYYGIGISKV